MTAQDRRFQVALSFPGEQRKFLSQVAACLSKQLGQDRVFYDDYYVAELARPDLDLYLGRIYHDDSELVVPFYSADYARKKWCRLEWRQMRDILLSLEEHRIMPFRFDDTPIPGILSIDGYVKIEKRSPQEVAELILQRLGQPPESGVTGEGPPGQKTLAALLQTNIREGPEATNPATLLNARYEVVPFFEEARTAELAALKAWCLDGEVPTSVRLFYGPAGTGKTRLFIEWAKQLRGQGWYAGFLPERVNEEQIESLLRTDKPAIVVLDYAECRAGLFELLKRIAERSPEQTQRLRIVLLARDVADWWSSLLQRDEAVRHLLGQAEPTRIAPVEPEGSTRRRIWEHARDAFAACLRKTAPSDTMDLEDPRFGRILYLHMSALAAVEGLGTRVDTLLDAILAHEKDFWMKRYQDQFGDDSFEAADFDKRCSRLVAAATLQGGVPSREAAEELNRRIEGPGPRYSYPAPFLHSLYAGRGQASHDRYLSGLEPDLLGEALVWSVLTDPENTAETFLERVFADVPEGPVLNGFVVLGRISLHDTTVPIPWLAGLLEADVANRARPAFLAALALGSHTAFSPLGLILAKALEREGSLDHAAQFDSLVPDQTVSLREVAVWTGRRLLEFLSTQEDTQENLIERARLLNNLGARLSDLGRREEALKAAQEAVDTYRRLAKDRPDAFLPHLAGSLNNLGAMLRELGRREEALKAVQEAVEIRRRLAKDRPDAFLPYLAASLNNLGAMLRELGRREEALKAAQEAVDTYRRLAKDRPDAFLPYLAASLNNLGAMLSELGRREEALKVTQEAVEIYRRLAKDRPDAFLPDLAMSLNNLGAMLSELGRREEALQAAQEAVDTYRRLAKDRPDAFLPDLATSLNNLGAMLRELGRREEALKVTQEAVEIYRRLAKDRPDAFLPNLAMSLNNLGTMLSELGRQEEALQAAQEAVDIRRRLAKDRPDAFLPDLATSLGVLGTCLAADVRLGEAVEAFAEGVRTLAPAFQRLPQAFAPLMGTLVSLYLTHVEELGESPDTELLAPIVAKFEEIKGSE